MRWMWLSGVPVNCKNARVTGQQGKGERSVCALTVMCNSWKVGVCLPCPALPWCLCFLGVSLARDLLGLLGVCCISRVSYAEKPRERNSGEILRRHGRKNAAKIWRIFSPISSFNFQEKWAQEISRKILDKFHEQ